MTSLEIIEALEEKLKTIHDDAQKGLNNLNERFGERYSHIQSRFELDIDYYINVATYAWGYRGKQIATYELQGLLNKLRKEINEDNSNIGHS